MNYYRSRYNPIYLERFIDKKCFGEYRAVREFRKASKKGYRINNGEVELWFRGEWCPVEERSEAGTDWKRNAFRELAEETGRDCMHVNAVLRLA